MISLKRELFQTIIRERITRHIVWCAPFFVPGRRWKCECQAENSSCWYCMKWLFNNHDTLTENRARNGFAALAIYF